MRSLLAAAFGALAGLLGLGAVETGAPSATNVVAVTARLAYTDDGEKVTGAAVTVRATGPAGAVVAPLLMTEIGDGVYGGTITLPGPGDWTVAVESAEPTATGQANVTIAAPGASSTLAPATTAAAPSTQEKTDRQAMLTAAVAVVALGFLAAWLVRRGAKRAAP